MQFITGSALWVVAWLMWLGLELNRLVPSSGVCCGLTDVALVRGRIMQFIKGSNGCLINVA